MGNTQKLFFFSNLLPKKPRSRFLKTFGVKVAWVLAQILPKTYYPYLLYTEIVYRKIKKFSDF